VTSRQRLLTALDRKAPDRLPVAPLHWVQDYFLRKYMNGVSDQEFLQEYGFDRILWVEGFKPDVARGEYRDPLLVRDGIRDSDRIAAPDWEFRIEKMPGYPFPTRRFLIDTPSGTLSMILQSNDYTTWVIEPLIKNKSDVDILGVHMPAPRCDVNAVHTAASGLADEGIVMGHVAMFDGFGQPGCWQDAAVLVGIERLIMETFDDPLWVHSLLSILQRRKRGYVESLREAPYDLLILGGGDASSTVISPSIFEHFVVPYDAPLIDLAHRMGKRVTYHTCGGMMPILEQIADMGPDAIETFTPPGMGGDTRLAEAKKRIGERVCMIGGFDQFHFLINCPQDQTRHEVRRCFREAGEGGGYILAPSDHFFDVDLALLRVLVDEARSCAY
jgi:uroporphyrinogen decarboxylase